LLDLRGISSAHITRYVVAQTRRRSRGDAKLLVRALRSLLRFLQQATEGNDAVVEPSADGSCVPEGRIGWPSAV
jgi:hypothetical protein